ncbi:MULTISPECIES: recombinase family protein [Sphingomonas]|uniref:recombinase family protein n=1 Tax=Sphingomonas TaxID=13687 RepID=UPI000DF003E7|nr:MULTISPECIES: recombinase family protein [Sphingomonas]
MRCAIYTRKSSDEGLDQHFNSLDAQREACEAYVLSQAGEGWSALSTRYDDGGFSGGNMERPALTRLLDHIGRGLVDIVVVYKIDRLTRSLPDFARIVERFDQKDVSFVSVTQAFNTTSSMGRLTLNVLLSFAQFEREVTGERIRDKIAASKAKGMWMGGLAPLGYDLPADNARVLKVNAAEAGTVRYIFEQYLALGSVHRLLDKLEAEGVRSKLRVTRKGRKLGGQRFSRGAMFHLLQNRVYLGVIVHKDQCYPGQHDAIVARELFEKVHAKLAGDRRVRSSYARTHHPYAGKLSDAAGQGLVRTHSRGARGKSYAYYVPAALQLGRQAVSTTERFSATRVDQAVSQAIGRLSLLPGQPCPLVRAEVAKHSLTLVLPAKLQSRVAETMGEGECFGSDPANPDLLTWTVAANLKPRGGRARVEAVTATPNRDEKLITALRAAYRLVGRTHNGLPTITDLPQSRYSVRLMRLAFLSPKIQAMILDGKQPSRLRLEDLIRSAVPLCWRKQEMLIERLSA